MIAPGITCDNNRLVGLFELACAEYGDQAKLERFIRCGAAPCVKPTSDGMVEVALRFTEDAVALAALRDDDPDDPDTPTADELGETLCLARVPAAVVKPTPQG